ncbi:hypothetical protein EH240_21920 [Mesorhizobium tamadayense]|uniref:Uncharacterized protein n=1 Tax=Mesorhizobium tamadayense TaxID=425306 RepID=A0A3P3FDF9_9HYPH|nr:hypothetical protein EH240_21920 [Mesorhizobium tamadayense]
MLVAISAAEAQIPYSERMPVPVSMWQPLRTWVGRSKRVIKSAFGAFLTDMSNFAKTDTDQALALGIQTLKRLAPSIAGSCSLHCSSSSSNCQSLGACRHWGGPECGLFNAGAERRQTATALKGMRVAARKARFLVRT